MLFLVLASTLTLAMFSLATTNFQSASNLSDVARAQSAAEAGLRWMNYRFAKLIVRPHTTKGVIDPATADALWQGTGGLQDAIIQDLKTLSDTAHHENVPTPSSPGGTSVTSAQISVEADGPQFQVQVAQAADKRFLVVTSTGTYRDAVRVVSMQYQIDKKIKFAVVGKVPIQLGRNTVVEGPVAMATPNMNKGYPLLMLSDFMHFDPTLKATLTAWNSFLQAHHNGFDNRISVDNPVEYAAATAAGYDDINGDAYIDEFDFFLSRFNTDHTPDSRGVQYLSEAEFTNPSTGKLYEPDLFALLDEINGPLGSEQARDGYKDDRINFDEGYGKIRGSVALAVTADQWSSWLSSQHSSGSFTQYSDINDFIQGTVVPGLPGDTPVEFGVPASDLIDLNPANFKDCAAQFRTSTGNSGTVSTAIAQNTTVTGKVISASAANGGALYEESPKGSGAFQAVYKRPVFKNIHFVNCRIPQGLNALFDNCSFDGVTFVDTQETIISSTGATVYDSSSGMSWAQRKTTGTASINLAGNFRDTNGDGKWDQYKVPGLNGGTWTNVTTWDSKGLPVLPQTGTFAYGTGTTDQKTLGSTKGNNIRFNDCTFTGPLAGNYATAYTHFSNSWEFTGKTYFNNTTDPTASIVAPQVNIEMGSFNTPGNSPSTLIGVVVAGNIDIRGSSDVDGSIIVTGDGAGNTTLAYFGASDADTNPNTPMPEGGWGRLHMRYNPNRALPDGIDLPVELIPLINSYSEAAQ
jgi:hypothetical protein